MEIQTYIEIEAVNDFTNEPVKLRLKNVSEIETNEDVNNFTNTAKLIIASRDVAIENTHLLIKNYNNSSDTSTLYQLKKGAKLTIYSGYSNNLYAIFLGYLIDFKEGNDNFILLCEDEMYKLKQTKTLINSFPSPIEPDIIETGSKFVGQDFTLPHLVYWIFKEVYADGVDYDIFVQNLSIGKLRLKQRFTIAQILKFMKDRFGIYVYFKNVYTTRQGDRINAEPRLYIGWKYWYNRAGIKVSKYLTKPFVNFVSEEINDYTINVKLMYPSRPNLLNEYNRIIDDNMVWTDTGKDNLIVSVSSLQLDNTTVIRVFPDTIENVKLQRTLQNLDNNATPEQTEEQISTEGEELENFDDFIQLENDTTNVITLNIPNLTSAACFELAKKKYEEYEDNGYIGSVLIFGSQPLAQVTSLGDVFTYRKDTSHIKNIEIINEYSYYIDSIIRRIDDGDGFTQQIYSGARYYINKTNVTDLIGLN